MNQRSTVAGDLIDPETVARDYQIPVPTQAVWRCSNRYGWADMTIKIGPAKCFKPAPALDFWPIAGGVNSQKLL